MNKDNKVQVVITRAANLFTSVVFLCISIIRVNAHQWSSCWIWIWGVLSLINIVLLVIKVKVLKNKD